MALSLRDDGLVTITNFEYQQLKVAAREYETLKNALFQGGLSEETLQILLGNTQDTASVVAGHGPSYIQTPHNGNWRDQSTPEAFDDGYSPHNSGHVRSDNQGDYNPVRTNSTFGLEHDNNGSTAGNQYRPKPQGSTQRTILLSNLPPSATHKDVTKIVRGGRLLDIHLRKDNTAAVSFVDGADEFFDFVTKKGVEINGYRLEGAWAERQFYMPDHISSKLSHGATRNLVIRGAASKLSNTRIRDDMEHIHNLVVVDVVFRKDDVFVSLNSVHNALYARSCMMSRLPYKGSRIEFCADECAQPITRSAASKKTTNTSQQTQARSKAGAKTNIYALLEMDPSDASSDDDESQSLETTTTRFGGVSLDWQEGSPAIIAA